MVISLFYGIFSTLINKNNLIKIWKKMKFYKKPSYIFYQLLVFNRIKMAIYTVRETLELVGDRKKSEKFENLKEDKIVDAISFYFEKKKLLDR